MKTNDTHTHTHTHTHTLTLTQHTQQRERGVYMKMHTHTNDTLIANVETPRASINDKSSGVTVAAPAAAWTKLVDGTQTLC